MSVILDRIDTIVDQGIDLKGRTLFLTGEVESDNILQLCAGLGVLADTDPHKGITIVINSFGGEEDPAFQAYDTMRMCPCHITAVGTGAVMSAAALIFQAADFRMLTPSTRMMIHGGTSAKLKENIHQQMHLVEVAKEMVVRTRQYATLIAERAKLKPSTVMGWCRKDKFFSAEEAVRFGLADHVAPYPVKQR